MDTGRFYAIKVFCSRNGLDGAAYKRRANSTFGLLSSLQHPNIIRIFELLPFGSNGLCECLEYCAGGDLYTLVVRSGYLEEAEADCFFKQLMRGIHYIHSMNVAHRDLRPDNLLLSDKGCLKISNFDLAERIHPRGQDGLHITTVRPGPGPYIPPEHFFSGRFDPRSVDIWSAATIYITMRSGMNLWTKATVVDECFRDFISDCEVGKGYFLIEDTCHVRFPISSLVWLVS